MTFPYDISFITINYNGIADTCEMIESLNKVIHSVKYEVIVTDNASREDEASIIAQRFPDVKIIRSTENLGFAGGNNIAIAHANGKYLMFINNDTLVEEDHFDELIKRFEKETQANIQDTSETQNTKQGIETKKIGIICPKLRFSWKTKPLQWTGFTPLSHITLRNSGIGYGEEDKGQYENAHLTPFAHGAAMMVSKEALDKVGMMWEGYFLYYEEMDWSERFVRAQYKIMYDPAQTVFHKESQTVGNGGPTKVYYLTRNRLIFAKRNREGFEKWICYLYLTSIALLVHIPRFAIKGKIEQAKSILFGVFDFWRGKTGKR